MNLPITLEVSARQRRTQHWRNPRRTSLRDESPQVRLVVCHRDLAVVLRDPIHLLHVIVPELDHHVIRLRRQRAIPQPQRPKCLGASAPARHVDAIDRSGEISAKAPPISRVIRLCRITYQVHPNLRPRSPHRSRGRIKCPWRIALCQPPLPPIPRPPTPLQLLAAFRLSLAEILLQALRHRVQGADGYRMDTVRLTSFHGDNRPIC